MPRKKRQKQPEVPAAEPAALSEPLAALAEKHGLKPASHALKQLEPPQAIDTPPEKPRSPSETEIAPSPERNGKHVQKHRPDGPRRRDGEPAASYTGKSVRVIKDGDMWQVEVKRDLTDQEHAKMTASGFDDVSENGSGRLWNASQKMLAEMGTDINIVAVALDAKGERLGRGR